MDNAGENWVWFVLTSIGLYTFLPADPAYLVSVPLFDKVEFELGEKTFTILKKNSGKKISSITYDGKKVDGYFIPYVELIRGKTLVVTTQ